MSNICPSVRAGKACLKTLCSFIHDVHRCRICQAPFTTFEACMSHQRSQAAAHRKVNNKCSICSVNCTSWTDYQNHIQGRKHERNLIASGQHNRSAPGQQDIPIDHLPCTICDTTVPGGSWDSHVRGKRHRSNQTRNQLKSALLTTEGDKHGISITGGSVDFGTINGAEKTVTASKQIQISNQGSETIVLTSIRLSTTSPQSIFQVADSSRRRQLNRTNRTSVRIDLRASKKHRGLFENRLEFLFEIPSLNRRFAITRQVMARIGSNADYETMKVTKAYVPRNRARRNRIGRYFAGVRPQALAEIKWERELEYYDMPDDVQDLLARDDLKLRDKIHTIRSNILLGELAPNTYKHRMQVLLWIEEHRARDELREYDREDVRLSQRGMRFELEVPGLAEKRPSVIIGDRFFVSESGHSDSTHFEGFAHGVENRVVLLQFNGKFADNWSVGRSYGVHFSLNRLVFRRMHQAVTRPSEGGRISFPEISQELLPVPMASINALEPYDSKIASNGPQLRAVASILQMPPGNVPFIIFGPPGTGKTVTMVEAIRQILVTKPDARILACAPSNSASDIIVERLAEYRSMFRDMKKSVFRLIAPSRSPQMVSRTVCEFSRTNSHGIFVAPPREELETFRVIVSTCCSGGVPYGMGFEQGHFTHIFIDEAAQATEPEVMIPIKTMLGPNTNVVLSGDVKQLGPIIRSPIARELGLGVSYVERLMSTQVYNEDRAKGRSMVKLTKNYRSHQAILSFPNSQFYKNELEACAKREITHCIVGRWNGLVKNDYPVIFHGVCGQDMREDPSPSYFNPDEVIVVKDYVRSLLEGNLGLESKEIGVITPYRAQVLKLRQLLRPFAPEITVGSVEEFQGQERKVIIISTVRSSSDKVTFDLRHTLGFVASPRRFNVAVTRAQALLVVIGDPFVLGLDPLWKEFINHVDLRGGYTGVDLDWDTSDPVDHDARLDETRRAQGVRELEELVRRTSELELSDDDVFEDAAAFREDD